MAYENDLQMNFVNIGLEEGEKRGWQRAHEEIARRMQALGVARKEIARLLGLEEGVVEKLLSE